MGYKKCMSLRKCEYVKRWTVHTLYACAMFILLVLQSLNINPAVVHVMY